MSAGRPARGVDGFAGIVVPAWLHPDPGDRNAAGGASMIYQRDKTIRFGHCDPAGIVFYPRYAELCNEVVEDWFADGLGVDFRELHRTLRLGIPAVRLEMEFLAPSRCGDVLTFQLSVLEVGRSSATLAIGATGEGRPRLRARLKIVLMSLETMRPVPLDGAWRGRLAPWALAAPGGPPSARDEDERPGSGVPPSKEGIA